MIIEDLIKLANHFDSKGLTKEADYLDKIISKAYVSFEGRYSLGYDESGFFYDASKYYKRYIDSIMKSMKDSFKSFDKSKLSEETKEKLDRYGSYYKEDNLPFSDRCPVYVSFDKTDNGYKATLPFKVFMLEDEKRAFVDHMQKTGALNSSDNDHYQKNVSYDPSKEHSNIVVTQVIEFKPLVDEISELINDAHSEARKFINDAP